MEKVALRIAQAYEEGKMDLGVKCGYRSVTQWMW